MNAGSADRRPSRLGSPWVRHVSAALLTLSLASPGEAAVFPEPGVLERYKWLIAASVAALVAQSLVITVLWANRVTRRRAEQSLRESITDLKAERAALSNLNHRLIEAQEQERSRLARELHDDVCQQMTVLAFAVRRLGRNIPESAKDARQQEQELQDDIAALSAHVSAIADRLHSSKLALLGLAAAADTFCKEASSHDGIAVEFAHENVPDTLPPGVALTLFRVLQEAVTNAARHSGAPRCRVSLYGADDQLHLEVVDEGEGFDTEAALTTSGLGLVSMRERLTLVNGSIAIESKPGSGTTIRATVPLEPQGAPN